MTFEEMRFRGTVKTALTNRFLLPTKQVFSEETRLIFQDLSQNHIFSEVFLTISTCLIVKSCVENEPNLPSLKLKPLHYVILQSNAWLS